MMKIDDIKKLCNLRRVVRLTNKTKVLINEDDYLITRKDNGDIKIAALVKNSFVIELFVDSYTVTKDDLISFYQEHELVFKPYPDGNLRKYRRYKL